MSERHTPGPWRVAQFHESTGESEPEIVGPDHVDSDDCQFIAGVCEGLPETDANARLIAAAPALLEALKDTLHYVEPVAPTLGERIRATITLAEGGEG
jgi:hypothetical protein